MCKQIKSFGFLAIPILLLVALLSGCKKNDVSPSQQLPKISGVFPSEAIVGTPVVIKGSNLKNVAKIKFGTREAVFNGTASTDTSLATVVPDSLLPGELFVQVYYNEGSGYAASEFKVLETPKVPEINSTDPEGTAYPGDKVIIRGKNFLVANGVKFGSVEATFTATDEKIEALVPWDAAGGDQLITVSSPNGNATIPFNVNLAPLVFSFSPTKVNEGDMDTVRGIRFTGTTAVLLGSQNTVFNVLDDTTLTFTVPVGGLTGLITVTTPNGSGVSKDNLVVSVAGVKLVIYDDVIQGGFSKWGGWGGSADESNTEQVEGGNNSVKIGYVGGWGSPLQLGGASIDLSGYTTFKISIYGGDGVSGTTNKVKLVFNGADGKEILVEAGVWTDFEIPLSEISSAATLSEIWIQEFNGVDKTIYVDNIGLN